MSVFTEPPAGAFRTTSKRLVHSLVGAIERFARPTWRSFDSPLSARASWWHVFKIVRFLPPARRAFRAYGEVDGASSRWAVVVECPVYRSDKKANVSSEGRASSVQVPAMMPASQSTSNLCANATRGHQRRRHRRATDRFRVIGSLFGVGSASKTLSFCGTRCPWDGFGGIVC